MTGRLDLCLVIRRMNLFAGVFICIDTDFICYSASAFVIVFCAVDCWLFRSSVVSLYLLLVY